MDAALQAAWRAARQDPRDVAARLAYAQRLEQLGRAAAAFHERAAAERLGGPKAIARGGILLVPGSGEGAWSGDAVVAPDREDGFVPGARVLGVRTGFQGGIPWPLVDWPGGTACSTRVPYPDEDHEDYPESDEGECEVCDGGRRTRACPACGGTGGRGCRVCHGWHLVPPVRAACTHDALEVELRLVGPDDHPHARLISWTLLRCATCGLAALRRDPGKHDHAACHTCGRFVCGCVQP